MPILNIAEKPSVAKSISRILSTNCRNSKGTNKYCNNIYFECKFNNKIKEMVFTSVLGHLVDLKFVNNDNNWKNTNPRDLFDSEIISSITEDNLSVARNIKNLASSAELVIIWTDCDREGENIAYQIQEVVRSVNKYVSVRRARFSAISSFEINNALNNLVDINYREAEAVECRKELDLRIGSSFTRIQTLSYDKGCVLSFGPCQIPTLNFVVQRHFLIENFIPENFYGLENTVKNDVFKWKRNNLFDKNCVIHFYNILSEGKARIMHKTVSNKEKYRPLPLRTVEFQKACSSYYKIDGHRIMEIAEKLYNNGYISYPRTETDGFPKEFGFKGIIGKLEKDSKIGEYASNFTFKYPRSGSNNDQAHSPIYPLKDGSDLDGDERKIYEFVARRFLGCISENAKGVETEYLMQITKDDITEDFYCTGLNITERNYLDIYIYDKWENTSVGDYQINTLTENNLSIKEGHTSKPEYLTESDLINLMDKNGIGTDATIHEHIHKIQIRKYCKKVGFRFIPLPLGINLINSYNIINLPISEPTLRKNLEESLKAICTGQKNKEQVLTTEITSQKFIYDKLVDNINLFKEIMSTPGTYIDLDFKNDNKKKKSKDDPKKNSKKLKSGSETNSSSNNSTNNFTNNLTNILTKNSTNNSTNNFTNNFTNNSNKLINNNNINIKNNKSISSNNLNNVSTVLIKCDCKKDAKLLEAKKGENSGRKFYCCNFYPKKCNFFQWENGEVKRIFSTEINNINLDEIKCYCGFDPIKKISNTENNKGREFLVCNKNYKKCKFFKWVE